MSKNSRVSSGSQLGIGLIGAGFMGRTYAECLARRVEGGHLISVTGGRRAPQLAADYGIDDEPSIEVLVARNDVAAVIIATPEMVHLEQVKLAAAAGKDILVEKPMAPTVAQCDTMIEACRQSGVTLMVVQSQRFRGVHRRAHRALRAGQIGPVRQIRHWSLQPEQFARSLAQNQPFTLDPAGSGMLMGWSVHSFDLIRWLAGSEAHSVFAHITGYGDHSIPDLSMMAQIAFENGVMAQLWVCLEMPGHVYPHSTFHTQVIGEEGLFDLDSYAYFDITTNQGWQRRWTQPPLNLSDPRDPARLESFSLQLQAFVDAIREDREPPVTGADGRAAVELGEAALRSAHTGQVVTLPLRDVTQQ